MPWYALAFGSHHKLPGILFIAICITTALTPGSAGAQGDQPRRYIGLQIGIANPAALSLTEAGPNHPTKCDKLLYPGGERPDYIENDPACHSTETSIFTSTDISPTAGLAMGFMVGFATGRLRFEVEYLARYAGRGIAPTGFTPGDASVGKTNEWSEEFPPDTRVSRFSAHHAFINGYFDFPNTSRWTPFVGVGGGIAATNLAYFSQFVRKPDAEFLEIKKDENWPDEAKLAAAGTVSVIDAGVGKIVFGGQLLAGADYTLSARTSVGVVFRVATFGNVEEKAVVWELLRSHKPVQADGVTPFATDLTFGDVLYQAMMINMKYYF